MLKDAWQLRPKSLSAEMWDEIPDIRQDRNKND